MNLKERTLTAALIQDMQEYLTTHKEDYETIVLKNGWAGDSIACDMYYQDVQLLIKYIKNLEQENHQLKDRIEKAIEYIEWQRDNPQYDNVWRSYECNGLLKILKGE